MVMETISSKQARDNLSDILNQVAFRKERYILTRSGKNMAVLLSMDEWKLVEKLLQDLEDREDIRDADEAHARYINNRSYKV